MKQAGLLGRVLLTQILSSDQLPVRARLAAPSVVHPAAANTAPRPDSVSIAESYRHCQQIARAARSNFYYAFYLLPKPKRDGLAALYAFMRLVDDVADQGADVGAKHAALPNGEPLSTTPSTAQKIPWTPVRRLLGNPFMARKRSSPHSSTPCAVSTCPRATCTT